MTTLVYALGLVLTVEGLVLALAPSRLESVLEVLARMSKDMRRLIGLTAIAVGVVLIWLAKTF